MAIDERARTAPRRKGDHIIARATDAAPARPDVAVVLGPWGSGTSAVAAVAAALGANAHPPLAQVRDARTAYSGESVALRSIVTPLFDHGALTRVEPPPWTVARLRVWAGTGLSVAKMPALAFFLPEVLAAWQARFLIVRRSLEDIETSRLRRGWPEVYGRSGAERIYAQIGADLPSGAARLDVQYDDLQRDPAGAGAGIARFLGLAADADAIRAVVRPAQPG